MAPRSKEGYLIGLEGLHGHIFKVYLPDEDRVVRARDVRFHDAVDSSLDKSVPHIAEPAIEETDDSSINTFSKREGLGEGLEGRLDEKRPLGTTHTLSRGPQKKLRRLHRKAWIGYLVGYNFSIAVPPPTSESITREGMFAIWKTVFYARTEEDFLAKWMAFADTYNPTQDRIFKSAIEYLQKSTVGSNTAWHPARTTRVRRTTPIFNAPRVVDGKTKNRWVADLRILNSLAVPDAYPMPRQEHMIMKLRQKKYISAVDAKSFFHQFLVHPDHVERFTLVTHRGLRLRARETIDAGHASLLPEETRFGQPLRKVKTHYRRSQR
ncbi:hypothetical protein CP532_6643 [Ophiocordyceps camponoti-leonardi (nom. inval.)]|nr:hypothetical protein CP532_6643 [Ophiocordyceps camponoti-leonardi (nom. inval.)]